ncbi:MAG TPA: hypothetical protein VEI24_00810, partial [Nitrospiria bacterium]|nr:hypothetical protein [Nitrospiria bacterium]
AAVAAEEVVLNECVRCGEPTTGTLCGHCRVVEPLRQARPTEPASRIDENATTPSSPRSLRPPSPRLPSTGNDETVVSGRIGSPA